MSLQIVFLVSEWSEAVVQKTSDALAESWKWFNSFSHFDFFENSG